MVKCILEANNAEIKFKKVEIVNVVNFLNFKQLYICLSIIATQI